MVRILTIVSVSVFAVVFCIACYIYLINASWLASKLDGNFKIISHRGVYQTYNRENLGKFDCTATRIFPPTHEYLENTLASIEKALQLGADIIEIDIKTSADGQIVVFHDHTLDCRTDATGSADQYNLAHLKTLDIGFGYTADNGKTFPFRGKGIGLIPSLEEVLRTFPNHQFLINIKNGGSKAADELVDYLKNKQLLDKTALLAYGSKKTVRRLKALVPSAQVADRQTAKKCLKQYVKWGWTGFVPNICKNTYVYAPVDKVHLLWGWPNRFLQRMASANTGVTLMGPMRDGRVHGFYQLEELEAIPKGFNGAVWVEKIEALGPALTELREANSR